MQGIKSPIWCRGWTSAVGFSLFESNSRGFYLKKEKNVSERKKKWQPVEIVKRIKAFFPPSLSIPSGALNRKTLISLPLNQAFFSPSLLFTLALRPELLLSLTLMVSLPSLVLQNPLALFFQAILMLYLGLTLALLIKVTRL